MTKKIKKVKSWYDEEKISKCSNCGKRLEIEDSIISNGKGGLKHYVSHICYINNLEKSSTKLEK